MLFTTATPKSLLATCIEALVVQVFSISVAPETGKATIMDDVVRKTRTSAKAKALLIATTSLLDMVCNKRLFVQLS